MTNLVELRDAAEVHAMQVGFRVVACDLEQVVLAPMRILHPQDPVKLRHHEVSQWTQARREADKAHQLHIIERLRHKSVA